MKKEERLNRLFGDIDDDLVAGAANRPIPLKVWLPRVAAAVAAVALTVGVVLTQPWAKEKPPIQTDTATTITTTPQDNGGWDRNEPVEEVEPGVPIETAPDNVAPPRPTAGTPTSTVATEGGIWYEPKWEDKTIWQQFPDFERFDCGTYVVHDVTVSEKMVEEYIEDVTLYGYDIYTETGHEIVGKIYRIKGINPACAVALQYPDRTDYFPAVCSKYPPATLGQFIADLNLREHLRVGTVYYSYRDENGTYHDKEYAGLTVEKVWELLLFDESLPNVYDDKDVQFQFDTKISIRIDMPLLGYENISISLSENGYLRTNLLDTEKLFYIGEDKVDTFMTYVEENCRLQKDDELIPMPGDTDSRSETTMTSPAQPPLVTGTTVWKEDPV